MIKPVHSNSSLSFRIRRYDNHWIEIIETTINFIIRFAYFCLLFTQIYSKLREYCNFGTIVYYIRYNITIVYLELVYWKIEEMLQRLGRKHSRRAWHVVPAQVVSRHTRMRDSWRIEKPRHTRMRDSSRIEKPRQSRHDTPLLRFSVWRSWKVLG